MLEPLFEWRFPLDRRLIVLRSAYVSGNFEFHSPCAGKKTSSLAETAEKHDSIVFVSLNNKEPPESCLISRDFPLSRVYLLATRTFVFLTLHFPLIYKLALFSFKYMCIQMRNLSPVLLLRWILHSFGRLCRVWDIARCCWATQRCELIWICKTVPSSSRNFGGSEANVIMHIQQFFLLVRFGIFCWTVSRFCWWYV